MIADDFRSTCETVRRGETPPALEPALEKLRQDAEAAMQAGPFSVMNKQAVPPSGSKHDYFSLSVYFWPNPDTPDGLPYVGRDGHVNPEVQDYDGPQLKRMSSAVETLALAFALTGEERYAAKAAGILGTWFLDEDTRMNPHMTFAQFIPGDGPFKTYYPPRFVPGDDRPGVYVSVGGPIEGAKLPALLERVQLLRESAAWTEEDHRQLQDWFRNHMRWLLESDIGRDEGNCDNNHGSWYMVQVAGYALFCGEEEVARWVFTERFPQRLAMQVEPDGSMPIELGRSKSYNYVIFTLRSFFDLAALGERAGEDLWHHETEDGRSVRRALDWLVPYLEGQKEWTYRLVQPANYTSAVPLLWQAARAYGEQEYARLIGRLPNYQADHRYRLLYPLDL